MHCRPRMLCRPSPPYPPTPARCHPTYNRQVVMRQFSVKTTCIVVLAFCVIPAHRVHPHWLAVILHTVNKLSSDNVAVVKTTCMVVLAFCVVPTHRVHPHWLAVILHTVNRLSSDNLAVVKTTCIVVLVFCVVPAHRIHPHRLAVILHTVNKFLKILSSQKRGSSKEVPIDSPRPRLRTQSRMLFRFT
jgi:hypothetical protein